VVAILTQHAISFTEIAAHRTTLEEAYMELTRDSAEYRGNPGGWSPARAERGRTS
jgi:ABC-2 type transport system ATP-binding protein